MPTGSVGTPSRPLSKLFTERVVLEERTSDPSNPAKGAVWFRSDLDSGTDKFGEIRWYDGGSTNSVPVFDKGTSGSAVEEVLGVGTANGVGFVPVAKRADATYPQLTLRHAGTDYGIHDAQDTTFSVQVTSGLLSRYDFESPGTSAIEDTATSYADSSAQDLTNNGAAYVSSPVKVNDNALDFDDSNTESATDGNYPHDEYAAGTLMFWAHPATAAQNQWAAWYGQLNTGETRGVAINGSTGKWRFVGFGADFDSSASVDTGQWQHLAITWNSGSVEIYKDGSSVGSASKSLNSATSQELTLGEESGVKYYDGTLDDVRLYNDVKSASTISDIYNNTK